MPKVEMEMNLEQLAALLSALTPGEQETLALQLDRAVTQELLHRRTEAQEGATLLTCEDLLAVD